MPDEGVFLPTPDWHEVELCDVVIRAGRVAGLRWPCDSQCAMAILAMLGHGQDARGTEGQRAVKLCDVVDRDGRVSPCACDAPAGLIHFNGRIAFDVLLPIAPGVGDGAC